MCRRYRRKATAPFVEPSATTGAMLDNPAFVPSHMGSSSVHQLQRPWYHEHCRQPEDTELFMISSGNTADGCFTVCPAEQGSYTRHVLSYMLQQEVHHVTIVEDDGSVIIDGRRCPHGVRSLDGLMILLQRQAIFGIKTPLCRPVVLPDATEPPSNLRKKPMTREPRSYSDLVGNEWQWPGPAGEVAATNAITTTALASSRGGNEGSSARSRSALGEDGLYPLVTSEYMTPSHMSAASYELAGFDMDTESDL
jgi:hypothetical protein